MAFIFSTNKIIYISLYTKKLFQKHSLLKAECIVTISKSILYQMEVNSPQTGHETCCHFSKLNILG